MTLTSPQSQMVKEVLKNNNNNNKAASNLRNYKSV